MKFQNILFVVIALVALFVGAIASPVDHVIKVQRIFGVVWLELERIASRNRSSLKACKDSCTGTPAMNLSLAFALMLAASPVMAQNMTGDLDGTEPFKVVPLNNYELHSPTSATLPLEPYKMCCQPSAPKVGDKWIETGLDKTQWQCGKRAANEIPACSPIDLSWHLLTQSYGGTVSLIKDLTKDECEKAKAIFVVPPCAAVNGSYTTGSYTTCLSQQPIVGDGDIKSAECFQ